VLTAAAPGLRWGRKKARGGSEYFPAEDMVLLRGVADALKSVGIIFTDDNRPATAAEQKAKQREAAAAGGSSRR